MMQFSSNTFWLQSFKIHELCSMHFIFTSNNPNSKPKQNVNFDKKFNFVFKPSKLDSNLEIAAKFVLKQKNYTDE